MIMISKVIFRDIGCPSWAPIPLMDLFGLGTAAAGAASAAASVYAADKNYQSQIETNNMNYKIARETNLASANLWREQNRAQIEQWNRENVYNTPQAQVERLRAAGLNPAMNFGQGNNTSGNVTLSPAPTMEAAHMEAPQINYSDVNGISAGISSMLNLLDVENKKQQNFGLATDNQYKAAIYQMRIANDRATLEQALRNMRPGTPEFEAKKAQLRALQLSNELNEKTMSGQVLNVQRTNELLAQRVSESKATEDFTRNKSKVDTLLADEQVKMNDFQRKLLYDQLKATYAQIHMQEEVANINAAASRYSTDRHIESSQKMQSRQFVYDTTGRVIGYGFDMKKLKAEFAHQLQMQRIGISHDTAQKLFDQLFSVGSSATTAGQDIVKGVFK